MSLKPTSIPTKTLAASITTLSSSFKLNNILGWDGTALEAADFGTQAYCVFRNANRTRIELMEFDPSTIASASITITRRGLQFDGDLTTEVTGNKFAWTKGDTFIDLGTDAPQVFQWMKEYIDAASVAGAVDASTTAKGIVEEATQAEINALTSTGGTGAKLFAPIDKMDRSATTIVPLPVAAIPDVSTVNANDPAVGHFCLYTIPFKITVNKISLRTATISGTSTYDVSLYSEDGQNKIFTVTTDTLSTSAILETVVSSVTLVPGNYWIMVNVNDSITTGQYSAYSFALPFAATTSLLNTTTDPVISGSLAITSGTPPTTFDPTALTISVTQGAIVRLDN
jgi:hypothetical protein